jgi:hypothetical protein
VRDVGEAARPGRCGSVRTAVVRATTPVRRRVPKKAKRAILDGVQTAVGITGRARKLPDFLILGAQKAGTTSLYEYLSEHPDVVPAAKKEVHYFDLNAHRSLNWYRGHFPLRSRPGQLRLRLTGEATPYYLFHPRAPFRVSEALPHVKLIVLLRHPVARAYSAHNHEVALGWETLPFEEALAREPHRLAGEEERMLREPRYASYAHGHYAYLERGRYARQIRRWMQYFPREGFLFLKAEELFADPASVYARVLDFLGLPPFDDVEFSPRNVRRYPPIPRGLWQRLNAACELDNKELNALIGEDLGWGVDG